MESIPTKDAMKQMTQQITADQIVSGYQDFLAMVNSPIKIYTHSRENLKFLTDKVFEMAGAEALLFGGSWLEAFHRYGGDLPTKTETEAEAAARIAQAEADRAVELEARDREAGRPQRHLSEADIEAEKDRRQKAYEGAKSALERRVSDIRNAEAPAQPTMADAYDALRSTQLERAALVKWIRETPTEFLLSVRKLPFSTTETWGQKIDAVVVAGKTNV